jgi:hypothetical protein
MQCLPHITFQHRHHLIPQGGHRSSSETAVMCLSPVPKASNCLRLRLSGSQRFCPVKMFVFKTLANPNRPVARLPPDSQNPVHDQPANWNLINLMVCFCLTIVAVVELPHLEWKHRSTFTEIITLTPTNLWTARYRCQALLGWCRA